MHLVNCICTWLDEVEFSFSSNLKWNGLKYYDYDYLCNYNNGCIMLLRLW